MSTDFIILVTPKIRRMLHEDLRLLSGVYEKMERFLTGNLPEYALRAGAWGFALCKEPHIKLTYLSGASRSSSHGEQYLILSGEGDGLGPTDHERESVVKGVFPSKAKIRAGEWFPLERIHMA